MISLEDRRKLYSPTFLSKVESIKRTYGVGREKKALRDLQAINEETLRPVEKAMKYNLIGVILFAERKYEKAVQYFDKALETAHQDTSLASQIMLNSSGSYFKLGFNERAYKVLRGADPQLLPTPRKFASTTS